MTSVYRYQLGQKFEAVILHVNRQVAANRNQRALANRVLIVWLFVW